MTRALVIGRRRPGRQIGKAVRETRKQLEAAGWAVDGALVTTKGQLRHATARAVKRGVDVVVAVGGDGAVLQVVQSLAGTQVALGIIPMGTGNLLAGNLEIPKGVDDAVKVLVNGGRRRIDLGRLTASGKQTLFAVACGVGFDAEVMESTDPAEKEHLGKLAYVVSAIRRQGQVHDVTYEVTLDGVHQAMEAAQVLIANFGGMGAGVRARLEVEPDDGLLDVMVISASGPLGGLLAGWEALRQDEPGESPEGHVFRTRARKVRVSTAARRLVETDGSVAGRTPIRVSVRPAALTVIVPAT
jgi:YegS/Rv2252/BmrU family lipid kinase